MNNKFISDNPELLHYAHKNMHITVLGGIKFSGLARLRVTLKIVSKDNLQRVFRHNVDLYNSMQADQPLGLRVQRSALKSFHKTRTFLLRSFSDCGQSPDFYI